MQTLALYRLIAQALCARINCQTSNNNEWLERWENMLQEIESNLLPSGSGIDSGCKIDLGSCTESKIAILSSVHMMNDAGMYDSWQDFKVIVRPSFQGISLTIQRIGRGNNRLWSDWIDDLYEQFQYVLTRDVIWDESRVRYTPESFEAKTA